MPSASETRTSFILCASQSLAGSRDPSRLRRLSSWSTNSSISRLTLLARIAIVGVVLNARSISAWRRLVTKTLTCTPSSFLEYRFTSWDKRGRSHRSRSSHSSKASKTRKTFLKCSMTYVKRYKYGLISSSRGGTSKSPTGKVFPFWYSSS